MERGDIFLSRTSKIFEIHKKIREKFEKIWIFFEILRFFRKIKIFHFFPKKSIENRIEKNRKKSQNFENFSDFFDFLNEFFMDFKKNWCSGKLKFPSFQKVPCLFTKYAPLALCMAVSEKPVKKTVFHVKSSLLGIEVTKSALDLPDQWIWEHPAPILIDAQIFCRHKNFFNVSNGPGGSVLWNLTCQISVHAPWLLFLKVRSKLCQHGNLKI